MAKTKILRNYNKMPAPALAEKALSIATKMTGNAYFPTPDVAPALLTTTANNLVTATAATVNGTPADTAHKKTVQDTLVALLDRQANYVENIAQNNPEIILSAGFDLASHSHAPALVTGTAILAVTNDASTKLGLKVQIDPNGWAYEIQASTAPGVWVHWETYTDPHDIQLLNLTSGQTYGLRARVLGSNNQRSEWSGPVSHMAT